MNIKYCTAAIAFAVLGWIQVLNDNDSNGLAFFIMAVNCLGVADIVWFIKQRIGDDRLEQRVKK